MEAYTGKGQRGRAGLGLDGFPTHFKFCSYKIAFISGKGAKLVGYRPVVLVAFRVC